LADAIAVARVLRAKLGEKGIESFVKTSGKTGLHVLTPWSRSEGFDEARRWAGDVGREVAEALPDQATVETRKAKRGQRVYIDVMPNARGHHAVPPYVLRAVPAAAVSTPLAWDELTPDLDPAAFTVKTIFRRIAAQKHDPLAGLSPSASGATATPACGLVDR
jgi:bifunctional non-homologous end joining protein LigD